MTTTTFPSGAGPTHLYNIVEAASVLGVPEGWLRKKVSARAVPHTRLGKHVRFTDDQLNRIVSAGAVEPMMPRTMGDWHGLSPRARRAAVK
jgi:excisionase family DNA binding protein